MIVGLVSVALPFFVSIEASADETLPPAARQRVQQALGFCSEVDHYANSLADFTTTKCLPSLGRKRGLVDLLFISQQPVFSVARQEKLWLLVIVGAVGKVAGDNPDVHLGEVCVSDVNLLKESNSYFVFPASEAERLQHQIYVGSLTIDQAYDQLSPTLQKKNLPRASSH